MKFKTPVSRRVVASVLPIAVIAFTAFGCKDETIRDGVEVSARITSGQNCETPVGDIGRVINFKKLQFEDSNIANSRTIKSARVDVERKVAGVIDNACKIRSVQTVCTRVEVRRLIRFVDSDQIDHSSIVLESTTNRITCP